MGRSRCGSFPKTDSNHECFHDQNSSDSCELDYLHILHQGRMHQFSVDDPFFSARHNLSPVYCAARTSRTIATAALSPNISRGIGVNWISGTWYERTGKANPRIGTAETHLPLDGKRCQQMPPHRIVESAPSNHGAEEKSRSLSGAAQ